MAGEQYGDKAVAGLLAWAIAQLDTYMSAVESAQSLADESLGRPDAYTREKREDDNRIILQAYVESSSEFEGELKLCAHDCTVAYHFHSDADTEAGTLKAARIMTALKNMIDADPTLNGAVTSAIVTDADYASEKTSDNRTRFAVAVGVRVTTYDG